MCYHCDEPIYKNNPSRCLVRTELDDAAFGYVNRASMHKSCGDLYADPHKQYVQMQRLKIRKMEPLRISRQQVADARGEDITENGGEEDASSIFQVLGGFTTTLPIESQVTIIRAGEGYFVRILHVDANANANANAETDQ